MWQDARMLNTIANGLVMVAFACLAATAIWWVGHRHIFDLTAIEVGGSEGRTLNHVSVEALAAANVNALEGNFFTVNLQRVREAFESAPWVRRAEVRRVWPNRLHVGIEEHEVLAHWNDGRFVNRHGELFRVDPSQVDDRGGLLQFGGPEGTQGIVTRRWHELSGQLAALSMKPRKVVLSDRQAWSAELDNGMTLLIGRDEGMPTQERVARWVAVHPRIQSRLAEAAQVVDLRYPNGFAIRAPGALDPDAVDHRPHSSPRAGGRP